MKIAQEHVNAIRALRSLSAQERLQAMWELEQADLHEAERAKDLGAVATFVLPVKEWESFKRHVLDGGGRSDADGLARVVLTALLDDDQGVFWPELIHFLKSAGKHLGVIVVQEGQVQLCGVAPTKLP